MKKIIITTLLFFLVVIFAQAEKTGSDGLIDLSIEYAKKVNRGLESEEKPLQALDQIKLERISADCNNTPYYIEWLCLDTIPGDKIDLYLVRYQNATFYIGVSKELEVTLNPNHNCLYYGNKCRLVYIDDTGLFIDEYGVKRKACVFMFAKGWGE